MNSNFKKTIALGMSAALALTICACGSKKQTDNSSAELPESKYGNTYPIQTDKKLTMWANYTLDSQYDVFEEQPLFKELGKRTGIEVDYQIPSGTPMEQFNLLIASGEYPDIIMYDWYNCYGNPSKALEDQIIIPLNDVFEKYAPNVSKYLDMIGDEAKSYLDDEGRYYGFPSFHGIGEENRDSMFLYQGPIVRADLLDKFGLEKPETLDEWYNMLKTFKDNGIKSPFVLSGKALANPGTAQATFLFGAFNTAYDYYIGDDGKIKYGPIQPEFKEALKVYNQWYKEGLLDQEFASIDDSLLQRKMTDGSAGVTLHMVSRLSKWDVESEEGYKYEGLKYPTINKGEKAEFGQYSANRGGCVYAAITTQCDDVELAAKYIDYGYTDEGIKLFNYGIEGETYDMVDGVPTFKDYYLNYFEKLNPYSNLQLTVHQINRYNQRNRADYQQEALNIWQTNMINHSLPSITPTVEESNTMAEIDTEIKTYVEEMVLKFITGYESLDNFDAFVENVKSLGVEDMLKSKEEQLERYKNR